jgi:hypothetical protein
MKVEEILKAKNFPSRIPAAWGLLVHHSYLSASHPIPCITHSPEEVLNNCRPLSLNADSEAQLGGLGLYLGGCYCLDMVGVAFPKGSLIASMVSGVVMLIGSKTFEMRSLVIRPVGHHPQKGSMLGSWSELVLLRVCP